VEGNLAKLNKLVRKGKTDADVLEDRLQKARSALAAQQSLPACQYKHTAARRSCPCAMLRLTQRCVYAIQAPSRLRPTLDLLRHAVSRIGHVALV